MPHFSRPLREVGPVYPLGPERLDGSWVTDRRSAFVLPWPAAPRISSDTMARETWLLNPSSGAGAAFAFVHMGNRVR